jgi:hypothetical protein
MAANHPAICPYDHQPILDVDDAVVCPGCHRRSHRECWEELGGCAVYGCPRMVEVKKPAEGAATFWGESEKTCPFCAERIPVGAVDCPLCRTPFGDVRPLSREAVLIQPPDPDYQRLRRQAIVLLVFSVLGCTSPFALVAGLIWYRGNQPDIKRFGAVNALAVISIAVCAIYLAFAFVGVLIWSVRARVT